RPPMAKEKPPKEASKRRKEKQRAPSEQSPERITPAEQAIMDVLWQRAPLAAADVMTALRTEKDWTPTTVKTLLSRLVEKGVVETARDGRRFLYSPRLARAHYERSMTHSFVDRLFGGRAAPLVAHLADAERLTDEDIAELDALLEELKNDRR
ncbi:MAG: BlaI/MecI/CopY family transcriptional regulator, partial [Pseudomonadota bacterium]